MGRLRDKFNPKIAIEAVAVEVDESQIEQPPKPCWTCGQPVGWKSVRIGPGARMWTLRCWKCGVVTKYRNSREAVLHFWNSRGD